MFHRDFLKISTPVCLIGTECLVIFASSYNSIDGYILGISIAFFDFMMDKFISTYFNQFRAVYFYLLFALIDNFLASKRPIPNMMLLQVVSTT